jgi:large subunit ribosomal protein L21
MVQFSILYKGKSMFAIIKTGGKQYRVQEGDILSVEKVPAGASQRIFFNQVLLMADDKETAIGTPLLEKAAVRAKIIEDFKDEKVIVFKKKRRKQYRRTRGHRQDLTRVRIERIIPDVNAYVEEEVIEPEAKEVKEVKPVEVKEKAEVQEEKKPGKREVKGKGKAEERKPEKPKGKKPAKAKKVAPAKTAPKKRAK